MWGTLPGKNHSDCLQRPITSARSPFSFSTLPKYTPDLAGNTSPSCRPPDLAGNIFSFLPVARPRRKHLLLLAGHPTSQETSSPSCRSPDLTGNIFSFLPVARPRRKHIAFLPVARPCRKHIAFLPVARPRRFLLPVHGLLLFLFRGAAQHFPDHIAVQAEGSGQLWNRRLHCPAYVGDQTGLLLQGQS